MVGTCLTGLVSLRASTIVWLGWGLILQVTDDGTLPFPQ